MSHVESSAPGVARIGGPAQPCSFTISDRRLRFIFHGLTPAWVKLEAGLYEVEVRNGIQSEKVAFAVEPDAEFDGSQLGVPSLTGVPVASALNRDRHLGESVAIASASLRDAAVRIRSGLIVVLLPQRKSGNSSQPPIVRLELLNMVREPLKDPGASIHFKSPQAIWHGALPPGGYVVRVTSDDGFAQVEFPIWLGPGFQTIAFVPPAGPSSIDNLSIHMLPIGWVWTGFDFASRLHEAAIANVRMGLRPFGASQFPWRRLASISPLLGILRLYDLEDVAGRQSPEFVSLAEHVQRLVPNNPDILVLRKATEPDFPPMFARGYEVITDESSGPLRVSPHSLLEATFAPRIRTLPYSTWTAFSGQPVAPPVERDGRRTAGGAVSNFGRLAHSVLLAGFQLVLAMARSALLAILLFKLVRLPKKEIADALQAAGSGPAGIRIARYLANVASLGETRAVWKALAGLSNEEVASAANMPERLVNGEMRSIRVRLRHRVRGKLKY